MSFELRDAEQRAEWDSLSASDSFQQRITGIALLHNKTLHTFPLPKKFRQRRFSAGLLVTEGKDNPKQLGEQVVCQADNIRMTITAYYTRTPKMIRYDVVKTGYQRHVGRV